MWIRSAASCRPIRRSSGTASSRGISTGGASRAPSRWRLLTFAARCGMQIELSEEQTLLRDTVRRFTADVVAPRAKEIDASGEFPIDFFRQAGELGLAGVYVPDDLGGAGMDMIAY